jgi:multidrug efflux pump subunit AcrA (membrane-fusion protein)
MVAAGTTAQSPGGGPGPGGRSRAGGPGGAQAERGVPELTGVVEVSERTFTTTVAGRLRPANSVQHSATVTGVVSDVRVTVGSRVTAGEALYTVVRDDAGGNYAPVVVRARIGGVVSTVSVAPNSGIRTGDDGVSIIDRTAYDLTAWVSDKDAFVVPVGTAVTGRTTDGASLRGSVAAWSPEPDYQTGLYSLTIRFAGTEAAFPGRFVTVDLPVERVRGVFVPQELLLRRYGRYYIWTVTENDTLADREVVTGRTHGEDILVVEGVHPGDRILLRRRGNEQAGMALRDLER